MKTFEKYFDRYAVSEIHYTEALPPTKWDHCVVLPARDEGRFIEGFISHLAKACQSKHVLLIAVINARVEDAASIMESNRKVLAALGYSSTENELHTFSRSENLDIWTWNFSGPKFFGHKEGVGLARKVGFDLAAYLYYRGQLKDPYIRSTDADVQLPTNYLQTLPEENAAAFIYPFTHLDHPNPHQHQAQQLYERYLHYYVTGLRYAQSPYAFFTVGSTLAIHAKAYVEVRGFPKRLAGEDFYVLNKLRKIGRIVSLHRPVLHIQNRKSARVPFGTGAAVRKIIDTLENNNDYRVYHPDCFHWLRIWLEKVNGILNNESPENGLQDSFPDFVYQSLLQVDGPECLAKALAIHKAPAQRNQHFLNKFDALKTLRFIHALQQHDLRPLFLGEAEARLQAWTQTGQSV